MKKLLAVMALITVFSVGCQEEEGVEPNLAVAEVQKEQIGQSKDSHPPHNRKWFDNGKVWGCTTHYYGNCLGDVTIRPSIAGLVGELITEIETGTSQTIQAYFENNALSLGEVIPGYLVEDVINYELTLTHKANMVEEVAMDYILFTNLENQVEVVVPFAN